MKQKLTFFAVLMMAMAIPQSVRAYDFSAVAPTGQTLYYSINGNDVTLTYPTRVRNAGQLQGSWSGYTMPIGNLIIPDTVEYNGTSYNVSAIDSRALASCTGLINVSIPNNVTSIGSQAFLYVNNVIYNGTATGSPWGAKAINGYLENGFTYSDSTKTTLVGYYGSNTTVNIPNTVVTIANSAFRGLTNISSVVIPNFVTTIGNTAFYGCRGLISISIPSSVTSIGSSAFAYCSAIGSITIPNTVSSIGYNAFERVANIVYSGSASGSPWGAKTVNGYLENGFVYTNASKTTLTAYTGTATVIVIPSTVVSIGDRAFIGNSNIASLSIPNSVTSIGSQSFYQCSGLSSITIPESVVTIGNMAFNYCSGLNTVVFNATNCTSMGTGPSSYAFNYCNNITTVVFGVNVRNIPSYAFYSRSSISSVTIHDSVTNIGACAFAYCTGITSLSVPSSVISIGNYAFGEIRNVSYHGTASGSPWGAYCINGYFEGDFIYSDVSKTVLCGYIGTDTAVTVPSTVTTINNNAFRSSTIKAISLPSSLTTIGDDAFRQSTIRSITLPSSLGIIGNRAFMQCSSLTAINIPNSVYSIGSAAFYNCSALETANISSSISTIGSEVFYNCINLHFVSLPQNLQSIGSSAFANCYKLAELNVPLSVSQIGTDAFGFVRNIIYNGTATEDCYMDLCYWGARCRNGYFHDSVYYADSTMQSLMSVHPLAKNIIIHNTTQSIANYAFYHCDVQSITYPMSVTSLGDQLYDGSTALRNIYCEMTAPPYINPWYDPYEFNYDSVTVHIPCGSLLDYTGVWHCFSHFVERESEYMIGVSSSNINEGTATILLSPTCSSNEAVIMAQPNDGFFFSMWDDSITSNPRYLVLGNDLNLVAIFTSTPPAPDTVQIHDTTIVIDTLWLTQYDTIDNYIHDTTYIDVHDTSYITLTDTVTNTLYDTIDNYIHDTTIVTDTLWLTQYDTIDNYIHDTTYIDVHDTTYITLTDTVTNTLYDTIDNYLHDTTIVTDTLWLTQYDTVWIYDTLVIHDTVYIGQEGVDDVETLNAKVYLSQGQIVVEGADGNMVTLYDISGRVLATRRGEYAPLRFDVPASGTYMLKIGNHPARKVVVIR